MLSPRTCGVVSIHENGTTNQPGILSNAPVSSIVLRQSDGTHFVLAHVVDVTVKVGDTVRSRHPHTHVGAWRDAEPLQIRFDQDTMGKLFE